MVAILSATARAATITVTITGTTGEIRVGEGPIFGNRSYTLIPPGDPLNRDEFPFELISRYVDLVLVLPP
jgi:hypothetical protein